MKAYQYTIRNVPEPVNQYLRKKSRVSGKSLNQVIIDELSDKVADPRSNAKEALAWFIGSGIDVDTLNALTEEDRVQKTLAVEEQ